MTLEWRDGLDGVFAESERYNYSIGGRAIGGLWGDYANVTIIRKSDGKRFERSWKEDFSGMGRAVGVEEQKVNPYLYCEDFEAGRVAVPEPEWITEKQRLARYQEKQKTPESKVDWNEVEGWPKSYPE